MAQAPQTWSQYGEAMRAWAQANPEAAKYAVAQGMPRTGTTMEAWGQAVGEWFKAHPEMRETLRTYDPAQAQTQPQDDEADLEALRSTMQYFAERPGSWEAAVQAGMPEYTPAMSPVEYSRQLAPFLEDNPSVMTMLARWPTQEQMGLVGQPWSKHPLDQVDVNDPEEVLRLFKRGQEEIAKLQHEQEVMRHYEVIRQNILDFENSIRGTPQAKGYTRQALVAQMEASQERDPAKAFQVLSAPQARDVGVVEGRAQAQREAWDEGKMRGSTTQTIRRKSEVLAEQARAQGMSTMRPGQTMRSSEEVLASVKDKLAQRGIVEPGEVMSRDQIVELRREHNATTPSMSGEHWVPSHISQTFRQPESTPSQGTEGGESAA